MVFGKPVQVSLVLGEGVACNTILSCLFLKTIKASIMTKNNALVSGLLKENFKLVMVVPQISKESTKKIEGISV